jgi:hypothetical protein
MQINELRLIINLKNKSQVLIYGVFLYKFR